MLLFSNSFAYFLKREKTQKSKETRQKLGADAKVRRNAMRR